MPNNQEDLSTLPVAFLVAIGIATVFLVIVFALSFRRGATAAMANRLERSIGLAIPEELRLPVSRRTVRRRRFSLAGSVLGLWVMWIFAWVGGGMILLSSPIGSLLIVGGSFAGGAVGATIGSVPWPTQHDGESIRYARPRTVTLADYVAPLERLGAWIVVGLAALALLTSALVVAMDVVPFTPSAATGAMMVAFAIVSLVFFEVVGRRMVGHAQPTGSEPELVWRDAMRSADLRGMTTAPLILGVYGAGFWGYHLASALMNPLHSEIGATILDIGMVLIFVGLMAILIYAIVSRPERYFLHRLWPQYVDVGALQAVDSHTDTTGADQ